MNEKKVIKLKGIFQDNQGENINVLSRRKFKKNIDIRIR